MYVEESCTPVLTRVRHEQLCNLLVCFGEHDVYFVSLDAIMRFNSVTKKVLRDNIILNMSYKQVSRVCGASFHIASFAVCPRGVAMGGVVTGAFRFHFFVRKDGSENEKMTLMEKSRTAETLLRACLGAC